MPHALGIDIGGTNIKIGLVSDSGELLESSAIPTPSSKTLADVVGASAQYVRSVLNRTGIQPVGVGIAAPGVVDLTGDIVVVAPNLPPWKDAPARTAYAEALRLPAVLGNDVGLFGVGEHRWGAARGLKNFIAVAVGTGVGGAIFIEGKLYRGSTGGAGELGFTIVTPDGPSVSGVAGVLEAYCGRAAFDDLVLELFTSGEVPSPRRITDLTAQGEPRARKVHARLAHYLAEAATSWLHILNPEAIIIGGGTVTGATYFFETFEQQLRARARATHTAHLKILPSQLGYYAGVLGAAALWFESQET
jgi:glucokinase